MCYIVPSKEVEPMEVDDDLIIVAEFNIEEQQSLQIADEEDVVFVGEYQPTQNDDDVIFIGEYIPQQTVTQNNDDVIFIGEYIPEQTSHNDDDDDVVFICEYISK